MADITGTESPESLDGTDDADTITGLGGNDTLNGLGGNDTLYGGAGADTVNGGAGDDRLMVEAAADLTGDQYDGGTGWDTLFLSYIGPADISGLALTGIEGVQAFDEVAMTVAQFNALGAVQALSVEFTTGGAVAPTGSFVPENFLLSAAGNIVDLSGMSGGHFFVAGKAGADTITGTDNAGSFDALYGNGGNDVLSGLAGYDILHGGDGSDVLVGGDGDDSIDGGAGIDTASYAGAAGAVSVDLEAGTASDGDQLDEIENLLGSSFGDTLAGDAGANVINGAGGADTMTGRLGNDTYYVDVAGDVVNEAAGEGTADRVLAGVSYGLGAGQEVELLSTTSNAGTGAINLTGNAGANRITGNAGANTLDGASGNDGLYGLGGNDTLIGGDGNDALDGGAGNDTMTGGLGDDTYVMDSAGDVVNELAGEGTDTLRVGFSFALARAAGAATTRWLPMSATRSALVRRSKRCGR